MLKNIFNLAMRILIFTAVLLLLASGSQSAFANVGFFLGGGADILPASTDKIRMKSEVVKITPQPFSAPLPLNGTQPWVAKYECTFVLENRIGKPVSAQVGFPMWEIRDKNFLSGKNFRARAKSLSGGKKFSYSPQSGKSDALKKFDGLQVWTMDFAPRETLELYVEYELSGYLGLSTLERFFPKDKEGIADPDRFSRYPLYLGVFDTAVMWLAPYITETGKSWAWEIESATFIFDLREFEKSLAREFPLALRGKKKTYEFLIENGQLLRCFNPDGEIKDGVMTSKFAPFTPSERPFYIAYCFSCIPKNAESFDLILKQTTAKYKKIPHAVLAKNLADTVLEFYGIATNNEEIKPFLREVFWYPAKNPPPLDPTLREKLLKFSTPEK